MSTENPSQGVHHTKRTASLPPVAARLEQMTQRGGPDDCWIFMGNRESRGYGRMYSSVLKGPIQAHRMAFALAYGPIPDGMYVMHMCDNPPCVNPAHLTAGTPTDNVHDMFRKGRDRNSRGYRAPQKTMCKRGHPMTEARDVYVRSDGSRTCALCARERQRLYLLRKERAA